jgi:tRNA modification GTPase
MPIGNLDVRSGMTDTIFAVATAPGKAGIAVLRVSGPESGPALALLIGGPVPPPRRAVLRIFRDPNDGEAIDAGLALWLPGPGSFTGEDMAELQVHGGRAVAAAMLRSMASLPGLRPAEPGEFSRRAFENGKLDLTAVEAIADLVNAETAAQRRQAQRQLSGALGAVYEGWRARLLRAQASFEAVIDFPDEDLPADVTSGVLNEILGVSREIAQHLDDNRRGERLREGLSVAVVGPPNAGKSSLLNWLVRREAAIVSATAGTTRDVIEVHLELGGFPVVVADTAGLRAAMDDVEAEGVRRALARAAAADLRVVVLDATTWPTLDPEVRGQIGGDVIVVLNKTDLAGVAGDLAVDGVEVLPISVKTGIGLDDLLRHLERDVARRLEVGVTPALTRERHRAALRECRAGLERAAEGLRSVALPELVAEDLRLAVRALGRITGKVDVEDMLDVVFREFCIGK